MRPVPKGFPPNSERFGPCCRRLSPVWPATIPKPLGHSAPQPLYIYSFLAQLGRRRGRDLGRSIKTDIPPTWAFGQAVAVWREETAMAGPWGTPRPIPPPVCFVLLFEGCGGGGGARGAG